MQGLEYLSERWKLLASPAVGDEGRRATMVLLPLLPLLPLLALASPAGAATPVTATACAAGPAGAPQIQVRVHGARSTQGNMTVTLYGSDPARFLASGGKLARQRVPVQPGGKAEACFSVSAPGIYAVAIYHDENNDHDFNLSVIGMPQEGYGFSNDAQGRFGAPSFEAVRFRVEQAGGVVPVLLRY
ncbi:DUF2141 domain-containing protein [Roseomonas haemaphysalidis]|nr:DUF2141 domain-containing protein [Roseomonas haemaphysalidis]